MQTLQVECQTHQTPIRQRPAANHAARIGESPKMSLITPSTGSTVHLRKRSLAPPISVWIYMPSEAHGLASAGGHAHWCAKYDCQYGWDRDNRVYVQWRCTAQCPALPWPRCWWRWNAYCLRRQHGVYPGPVGWRPEGWDGLGLIVGMVGQGVGHDQETVLFHSGLSIVMLIGRASLLLFPMMRDSVSVKLCGTGPCLVVLGSVA